MVADFRFEQERISGLAWGDSDAVDTLCLHGWLDNAASFHHLAPQLSLGNIVAVDLPGHGHSAWKPEGSGYAIWGYTRAVHALVSNFRQPVHLVAHSMGGSVAICLAAAFPEFVRSLVLLDSPGPIITPENRIAGQLREGVEAAANVRPSRIFQNKNEAIAARRKATPQLSDQALQLIVERNLKSTSDGYQWSTDPHLRQASELRLSELQVEHLMRAVTCPVLSIRAENGLLPAKFFEHRMAYLQNAESVELPGHHHFHLEPETVAAIADQINGFHNGG
ncbi:MAG: alpha/beta hydrolase [Thalassolituus sp.]